MVFAPEQSKEVTWKISGPRIPSYFFLNCHPAQPSKFSQICYFIQWYEFVKFWEILLLQLFLFNRLKIYLTDSYKLKLVLMPVLPDHLKWKHQCYGQGQDCRLAVSGVDSADDYLDGKE